MIEGSHFQLCAEYPNTEVNAAFATADNSFYVFSGNYYSKIRRFRRPPDLNPLRFNKLEGIFDEFFYYPEIEDGFPKRVQSEWNLHKSVDAGFTYESITYLVLGNDLWLFNNTKGNFFWHWFPSKALTVRDAKSIEAHFIGLPAYIDAGLTLDKGNVFIFKDDKLYKSSERLKFDYIEKRSLFEDVPEYVNAAWYHKNNESVYIFKGIDIFHYDMKSHLTDKRPISDFLGIPSYIDAAFTIHTADESYILKRSFFYKFEASYIRKRYFTPQLSFDVLFGCDKSYDYRKVGFENYNAFANRMAEFKPIPARSAFTKLRNVKHRHSMLDGERMLLAISATVILVAAVAITALFCEQIKRKHKAFEE
ncbi:matrix metalloproteinase-14-like protein [Dinothrombium tinctorium]|uniref:Matrix metalloproteinase-14-like protein n=1 Tax=Dinothrombium tinctorium TaxID=1965070 RepID=A0A3S3SI65_9ACAR|nr:matrix metalloproteinase-14-like protein [Dinothrombium tinctorium]RWS15604.1 matrix metalloproteinase-14-like protein [Dinothrombium tinctorium]RWS15608.1 matrix metalloproteinase-14-like protein [Dinothrombium tinctorium]